MEPAEGVSKGTDKLLQTVDNLPLESDSDISEITDVFEEFHKDSLLKPNAVPYKKYLTKNEGDRETVERFTEDFKRTMRLVREELGVNRPLFDEEEAIEEVLKGKQVVYDVNLDKMGSPIMIEPEKDKESESSGESMVWKRMLANSTTSFKVTPPIFNAFRQEEKHWLERPPISWKRVDNSRIKCEKWLDDVLQHT